MVDYTAMPARFIFCPRLLVIYFIAEEVYTLQRHGSHTVDKLGRILLPLEVRQALGIDVETQIIVYVRDDGGIVLWPIKDVQPVEKVQRKTGHGGLGPMVFL